MWIEWIVRVRTPIADNVHVYHYSKPVRTDATNQIVRIP